ncbi:MAG: adenylyl-sulfate kinase [Sandaracinaceae bacterium]|nr:adenylyl-sulfate kinase [Sandaracinaceae bacterium]
MTQSTNVTWHHGHVSAEDRRRVLGHGGAILWLTGLSGSGKSTVARLVEKKLVDRGVLAYVLDGDNVRHGLNGDLGFGEKDRTENIRRIAEVAKLMADAGVIVLTAFISPFRADRARARAIAVEGSFVEVHVATPLEECERRDPKGLYKKARAGEIKDFTGLDSPYEAPEAAEIVIGDDGASPERCADRLIALLEGRGLLGARTLAG